MFTGALPQALVVVLYTFLQGSERKNYYNICGEEKSCMPLRG
jgi:hypothetical protein